MKKRLWGLVVALFLISIVTSWLFMPQVVRSELARIFWDPVWCYPKISKKEGIKPTYSDIKVYILSLLHVGMTHDETLNILERFGSIEEKPYSENHQYKKISINLCSASDSYILIMVKYSDSGKLMEVIDFFDY